MTHTLELQYFFDPFCGWCYASAPALERLAARFPGRSAAAPFHPWRMVAVVDGKPTVLNDEILYHDPERLLAALEDLTVAA